MFGVGVFMSKYDVQALRNELEVIHRSYEDLETDCREMKQHIATILLTFNCEDAIRELTPIE